MDFTAIPPTPSTTLKLRKNSTLCSNLCKNPNWRISTLTNHVTHHKTLTTLIESFQKSLKTLPHPWKSSFNKSNSDYLANSLILYIMIFSLFYNFTSLIISQIKTCFLKLLPSFQFQIPSNHQKPSQFHFKIVLPQKSIFFSFIVISYLKNFSFINDSTRFQVWALPKVNWANMLE